MTASLPAYNRQHPLQAKHPLSHFMQSTSTRAGESSAGKNDKNA